MTIFTKCVICYVGISSLDVSIWSWIKYWIYCLYTFFSTVLDGLLIDFLGRTCADWKHWYSLLFHFISYIVDWWLDTWQVRRHTPCHLCSGSNATSILSCTVNQGSGRANACMSTRADLTGRSGWWSLRPSSLTTHLFNIKVQCKGHTHTLNFY